MSDRDHYEAMQRMAESVRKSRERDEKFMGCFLVAVVLIFGAVLFVGAVWEVFRA